MKTYPLSSPSFLSPFWFNKVKHGFHESVVEINGTILVEGEFLVLTKEMLPPGVRVRVWLSDSGFFECADLQEVERIDQERREKARIEDDRCRQRLNDYRAEAEAFNARIALPIRWDVGIKDVLSGLSEKSSGSGRNRATVEHIYLLEPLVSGRLRRDAGDFLCSSSTKGSSYRNNGKNWSGKIIERCIDGNNNEYQPKVTCKVCLAFLRRNGWLDRICSS